MTRLTIYFSPSSFSSYERSTLIEKISLVNAKKRHVQDRRRRKKQHSTNHGVKFVWLQWSIVLTRTQMADAMFITHFVVLLLTLELCPGKKFLPFPLFADPFLWLFEIIPRALSNIVSSNIEKYPRLQRSINFHFRTNQINQQNYYETHWIENFRLFREHFLPRFSNHSRRQ